MEGDGPDPESRDTRRRFLRTVGSAATATLAALSGCSNVNRAAPHGGGAPTGTARTAAPPDETDAPATEDRAATETATPTAAATPPTAGVRGAVYFPSRTFNHYQAWDMYNPGEAIRDVSYASALNLDALRVLLSYEFWRDHPSEFRRNLDHFLTVAADRGVRILPVLFESIGEKPTPANLRDRDVLRNGAIRSPSHAVIRDVGEWDGPRGFVRWFVRQYGDHEGLLAVEVMNEPGEWEARVEFCREMLRAARDAAPDVPLTMGCKDLKYNRLYDDPGLDVFQFHYNLPPTAAHMRRALSEAARVAREADRPVWLTEWQRTREEPPDSLVPNYSSLASVVRESDVDGDFFWQLMLKPAYGYVQRVRGRLNGVFYEDGRVYSVSDVRAISGARDYWRSRKAWPEWARELRDANSEPPRVVARR